LVVYDTYAWIEYFLGSSKGFRVKELLNEGGHTPSVVLAELARKYIREGVDRDTVRDRMLFISAKTEIVDISPEIALRAAETYFELQLLAGESGKRTPSLADAIIYATALMLDVDLVTGDSLFKGLPHIIYIGD
jgi:predicted nucleic acid-binding protein